MQKRKLKLKKCRACGDRFTPYSSLSVTCGIACAISYTELKAEKKLKRDIKLAKQVVRFDLNRRRDKLKSKSDWLKEAQTACNAYIRERDKDLPCISCQRHHTGQYHAGHYKTSKAYPELRFHPFNISKQCRPCNEFLSGNITEYRINLMGKIGIDAVEWLEGPHKAQNLTVDEIKEIKQYFKEQLKLLKN